MPGKGEDIRKLYSFLGLCARARGLTSGETAVISAIKAGKALLVLVAEDASENTKKMYADKCASHGADVLFFGEADAMGEAIGKNRRSAVAITDPHFAEELKKRVTLTTREL